MRRHRTALLILACALAACGKKDKSAPEAEATTSPDETTATKRAPNAVKKVVTSITIEEVTPMLAEFSGARVVKEPSKAQYGERVEVVYCFDQGEVAAIGDSVKAALGEAGWQAPTLTANPKIADRLNVRALREPFRMSGHIQRGEYANCSGEKGQTLLAVNIHKQTARPLGVTAPLPHGTTMNRPGVGPRPLTGEPQVLTPQVARPAPVAPPAPAPAP